MTSRRRDSLLATVLLSLCAVVPTWGTSGLRAAGPPVSRDTHPSVPAFLDHYIRTLEAHDEEAVRDLFVEDDRFAWFTDGALSYGSADDVLAGLATYADLRFETTLTDVHVVSLGDEHAGASASFTTRLTLPDGGEHTYGGVITWVLERWTPGADPDDDGSWRVVTGHTSTPGAPPGRNEDADR